MAGPEATVLIATRDRAEHIADSLTGVLVSAQQAPFEVEVAVVNNGSRDDTGEVLARFSSRWPMLRHLDDPIAGRSGVLNRALPQLAGRAVVFTDDDVHVPVSWVTEMAAPILDGTADGVCGRIVLADHLDRPWLTPHLRAALAEFVDVSGDLPGMVGANMAASREAAMAIGFDEELGPGERGFADDVLFGWRMKAAGFRLVGSAGPPVEHHLDSDRLTYAAMKSLAQRNGSSHAYLWHHWLHSDIQHLGIRRMRAQTQLAWIGMRRSDGDPMSEREYDLWFAESLYRHLRQERSRPPRYPASMHAPATVGMQ
jgi:glycosyltransferase involved in cell wall biosynthesis